MALEFDKEEEKEQVQQYGNQLDLEDPKDNVDNVPEIDGNDDDIEVPAEDAQLDLFGGSQPLNTKKEKKKTPATEPKATKPKPDEKVDTEFMIYYAGHRVPVPENDMTLEQVRSFLEGDFPELSKERTEMLIDKENKQVVPLVKGAKKG